MTPFLPHIDYDKDFETYVLGICLLEPKGILKMSILTKEMFYYDAHAVVFGTLLEMYRKDIPIDLKTTHHYLVNTGIIIPGYEQYQTAWFLCKLTNDVLYDTHLHYWCMCIKDMWQRRQIARLKIKSVDDLKKAQVTITKNTSKTKHYRFLLTYLDKKLIKARLGLFGAKTIAGKSGYKMGVSTPLLVFLMATVEPKYTWTCAGKHDELLTNEDCKNRLPKNSFFDGVNWIDRASKIPTAWL